MLSVVLYGRNDAHGYNLHKRGALSLNCIAEVLTEDDDELIFVDYNTPDELPTFPEALADTLTAQAKKRLRVIRVRGDYHRQFAAKTRLVALECQSRNIGIRRSNPNNRWVLSTNTDMIFCPEGGDSLSAVVAGLEDGFYHLPRYELPEGFWERLDRLDPRGAIAAMRTQGRRFHLNEIVYGLYDNVYEGPGDFQLFLRDDLFAVQGFDERMMLGWHADANMARRMRLLRGKVSSLFPKAAGYHCGHTRQATSLHKGVRTENSVATYVREVADPHAPWQAQTWGAPDWDFEEVRLDAPDLYFPALSRAVAGEGPAFSEASIAEGTFHKTPYDPDHVLPHLCDLVFNLPPDQVIFFFGDDQVLADGVRDFLEQAGRRPRFLLASETDLPRFNGDPDRWAACRVPATDALEQATLFIVQHPSAGVGSIEERSAQEWMCHRLLRHIAAHERRSPFDQRRRTIVVNGVHNGLSSSVEAQLAPTSMPFSTRMRQGFVIDTPTPDTGPVQILSPKDWTVLGAAAIDALAGNGDRGWERLAFDLSEVCETPGGPARLGLTEDDALTLAAPLQAALADARSRMAGASQEGAPAGLARSRLCGPRDWADPVWRALVQTLMGPDSCDMANQGRWTWERISLLDSLIAQVPPPLGLFDLSDRAKVLFVGEEPDIMPSLLAHFGYEVRFTSVEDLLRGRMPDAPLWDQRHREALFGAPPYRHPLAPTEARHSFDAVVMTRDARIEPGSPVAERLLAALNPLMKPGSLLMAAIAVELGDAMPTAGLSLAEWQTLFDPTGVLGQRGLTAIGGFEPDPPFATVVRYAPWDRPGLVPGLSFFYGELETCMTVGVVNARWPEALAPGPPVRRPTIVLEDKPLFRRLGRTNPLLAVDRRQLAEVIQGLTAGTPPRGWERLAPEIAAIAAEGEPAHTRFGLKADAAPRVLSLARSAIQAAIGRALIPPVAVAPRGDVATRLISSLDWEDPLWANTAFRVFGRQTLAERKPWIWERVSLAHAALEGLAQSGARRVLTVTFGPDPIAHILAGLGFDVVAATSDELLGGAPDPGWRAILDSAWLTSDTPARLWTDTPDSGPFDAVVVTQQALVERGVAQVDTLMATLARRLAPAAQLHATFVAQMNDLDAHGALTAAEWRGLYGPEGPLGARGFTPVGSLDPSLPLDTVVRFAPDGDEATVAGLSWAYGPTFLTLGVTTALWPPTLRPGPERRLEGGAEPFDPAAVPIPWAADAQPPT